MAGQRYSVYDNRAAVSPRPSRRIFQQFLLLSALACLTMGVMHIEPRMAMLRQIWHH